MTKKKRTLLSGALAALVLSGGSLALAPAAAAPAAKPGLRAGYRSTTLPVHPSQVLNVKPGDRVDIIVSFDAAMKNDAKERVAATILQNVVVLSIDPKGGAIELELNPNEAQYAVLSASPERQVWVVRRDQGDVEMKPMEMAAFSKLFR